MALGEAGYHIPKDPSKFSFDDEVSQIFDDMAVRSLPCYNYVFERVTDFVAALEIPSYSEVWDLGCSTGKGLKAVQLGARHPFIHYHGVDISEGMRKATKENCPWAEVHDHDLNKGIPAGMSKGKVAVAIIGWTLQFVTEDFHHRARIIEDAYDMLMPGGGLFVMEKFDTSYTETGKTLENAYYKWRRDNGYSLKEIEAKSVALKGSMYPWTPMQLEDVARSLFTKEWMWLYRQFNFGGMLIVKR